MFNLYEQAKNDFMLLRNVFHRDKISFFAKISLIEYEHLSIKLHKLNSS